MNQKLTFTAYLQDEYSKKFEKLADVTDNAVDEIVKDLDRMGGAGKRVARNIETVEKRMRELTKVKKMSVNTDTIKAAEKEIQKLQKELQNLHGNVSVSGGSGGGGGMFGGLGKGFAIGGGLLAAGAFIKDTGDKAIEATAKYQKYQAVLANMFGSDNKASQVMETLSNFAAKTPFQVDELTSSFVKLKGQGFEPALKDMTSLGDLAASKGKGFDQLAEALIDAQTGEFERLKEFGIKGSLNTKNGTASFMFNEQKTTVKNTASAIREYILALGDAKGVTGAMAAISKTTGGQISNLEDNFDLLYKTIGDRFKPEIDGTIGSLSSLVGTVKSWMDVPTSEKIKNETDHLQALRTELGFLNTTEARRKQILEEVKRIQPDIVDGTKSEREQLDKLNTSLDSYINKRRHQITMEQLKEANLSAVSAYEGAKGKQGNTYLQSIAATAQAATLLGLNTDGLTPAEASRKVKSMLEERIKSGNETNKKLHQQAGNGLGVGGYSYYTSDESTLLNRIKSINRENAGARQIQADNSEAYQKYKDSQAVVDSLLGGKPSPTSNPKSGGGKGGTGAASGGGSSASSSLGSISGGQKITHLNITIGNLVGGGVNIHSTNLKEGAGEMTDTVVQALLTAVNDANLAAN